VQGRKFHPRLAFGACGLIVLVAAVTFLFGSHREAEMFAGQAVFFLCITYSAYRRDRARRS
jgi:hypothetical protein